MLKREDDDIRRTKAYFALVEVAKDFPENRIHVFKHHEIIKAIETLEKAGVEFTPITRRTLIKTYCNFCGAMVDVDGDPKERSMLAVIKVTALYRVGPPNFVSTSPAVADAELPPSENVKIFQCCGIDKLAGAISHGQDRLTVALNLVDCCLEQWKLPESAIISEAMSLEFDYARRSFNVVRFVAAASTTEKVTLQDFKDVRTIEEEARHDIDIHVHQDWASYARGPALADAPDFHQ